MNKKGGLPDMFIFIIVTFILVVMSGIFIYISAITFTQLHTTMDGMATPTVNTTTIIDDTFASVVNTFKALYWISILLIVGMILSIFIGSYLVTTRPIFAVPYAFISGIAIVVSVVVSNAYEQIMLNPTLASTFTGFIGANFILSKLPIWVTIIAFLGGIIMFSRLGSKEDITYYG